MRTYLKTMVFLFIVGLAFVPPVLATGERETGTRSTVGEMTGDGSYPEELTFPLTTDDDSLTWWHPMGHVTGISDLSDHIVVQAIEKRLGVNFDFVIPPRGQEREHLNLILASNNLPDMIENRFVDYRGGPDGAIEDGILIEMNPYVDRYAPNFLRKLTNYPQLENLVRSDTGRYTLFGTTFQPDEMMDTNFIGPLVRKDILDELGLDIPQTIDDWHETLTAVKEAYPEMVPLVLVDIFNAWSYVDTAAFSGAYGVPIRRFFEADGEVKYGPIEPGYREYLATMAQWYSEGLINPDFVTHKIDNMIALMTSGEGFATVAHANHIRIWKEQTTAPGFNLVGAPYPALRPGAIPELRANSWGVSNSATFITNAAKDPILATKVIDYRYTEEGIKYQQLGIEGLTYVLTDDEIGFEYTELITNNPNGLSEREARTRFINPQAPGAWYWPFQRKYNYISDSQIEAGWKLWVESATLDRVIPPFTTKTGDDARRYASILSEVESYQQQMALKFILGIEPLSKFDEYVDVIRDMGIDEAIRIEQVAYERFLGRS